MKIPKRINPDSLKDAIVQIVFNSDISPELFLGRFHHEFSDVFTFKAALPKRNEIEIAKGESLIYESHERGFFLDKNEKIKVNVASNAIVFNIFQDYILWNNYFPVISRVIEKLFSTGMINEIHRIGVRYISQFDNTSLIDNLNMSLSLGALNKNLETTQVRTEFTENEFKVILTLINRINLLNGEVKKDMNTSIIDIDVIQTPADMRESKSTLEAIKNGHQKQKATFFSLLKPAFLETLNPEY